MNKDGNKKFLSHGSLKQEDVDKIVMYLEASGMNYEDIKKIGEYKWWFYPNPEQVKKNELSGKEKNKI